MTARDEEPLAPGDLVPVELGPVRGSEQDGRRPALVVSVENVHALTRRAIIRPITSNIDPWPTKVPLPPGSTVRGAIPTDQIRSIDRRARILRHLGTVPSPRGRQRSDRDPHRASCRLSDRRAIP